MGKDKEDYTRKVYVPMSFLALDDTPITFDGAVNKSLVVNDSETGLGYSKGKVDGHSARHEDGGADPISNLGGNVSFPDRSCWNLILSAQQSLTKDVIEKVKLDTVLYDNRGEFDSDNKCIVVDNSGFYWLSASLYYKVVNDQDRISVRIGKNGMNWVGGNIFSASSDMRSTVNVAVGAHLNAGDILAVFANNSYNYDTILTYSDLTFFSGCKIA